jgi:hypothetical protein
MLYRLLTPAVVLLVVAFPVKAAEYKGLCEASAGVFIDRTHFVVASDETNTLQIYERGKPEPVGNADMEKFTGFDKSDLEAAAVIDDRVYWISSHSLNRDKEDKRKRKVFFATKIVMSNGIPTLTAAGSPVLSLRDLLGELLAGPANIPREKINEEINIEGMIATPEGDLLIGLRQPLNPEKKTFVIPFTNPKAVVDEAARPVFGKVEPIVLEERGIRGMDLIENGQYLIVAGPTSDATEGFALFRWSGPGSKPVKVEGVDLAGLRPEGVMAVPGQALVQLLIDDGSKLCDDEKTPDEMRKFRSIDVPVT